MMLMVKAFLPILARRFTQLGIGLPVNLIHASLQKWLQFLVMRLYAFPLYSSAKSPIIPLTSSGPTSVHPIKIAFLKLNPSHCFGSPSNIPVVGYSWAPNAYSTPWTAWHPITTTPQFKRKQNSNQNKTSSLFGYQENADLKFFQPMQPTSSAMLTHKK